MNRVSLALAAVSLIAAGCETTEPPEPRAGILPGKGATATPGFEPPAPGTIVVVRHRNGALETSRVLGSEGYAVAMLRNDERITEIPFCFRCAPDAEPIESAKYAAIWPLEPGKSVTFRRRDRDGALLVHEVSVIGEETVTTDFGPVDTLVIEEKVSSPGEDAPQANRTQWFSPRLGWTIRSEWRGPEEAAGSWELAAIALPR